MKSSPSLYSAITGDSKLLAVLGKNGQLVRLFWPHIDFGQHVERYRIAIGTSARRRPVWLDSAEWEHDQSYVEATNTVKTVSVNKRARLTVETRAFCPTQGNCLVLEYEIGNRAKSSQSVRLFLYECFRINESDYYTAAYIDEESDAMVFYLRDTYIATLGSKSPSGFQCNTEGDKNGAVKAIDRGSLDGRRIRHKLPETAMAWDLGEVAAGSTARIAVVVSGGNSHREAIDRARAAASSDLETGRALAERKTRDWLGAYAEKAASRQRPASTRAFLPRQSALKPLTDRCGSRSAEVFVRSLLSIKLLSDRETGAIIAAPEFDREREKCGGYGYVWGRDAAFNAYTLDLAGMNSEAEAFYHYAKRIQQPSGVWLHRHYSTGELAPSWGLIQIDETGAILWGVAEHYSLTKSRDFLSSMWESIERGASYLCGSIDEETGLPLPSYELWEERRCESVYAAAAVAGGLESAARCADRLGHKASGNQWRRIAAGIRKAIPERLWNKRRSCFSRSIKRVVNEETFARHARDKAGAYYVETDPNSIYPVFYEAEDPTIDSSLLGLVFPFKVLDPLDPKMRSSARAVRRHLWWKKTGGLFRYEGDTYVGGNPWILTTLWLAIYHIEAGEPRRAAEIIKWAADHATQTGLLTEQLDKETGDPLWAVPLGWSHAMFVIASLMLVRHT